MPEVVQLESKWALEYGMPSTHAMVGLAVPLSILYFTYGRYQVKNHPALRYSYALHASSGCLQYPLLLWTAVAIFWCVLVCTSRVYLGMHSKAVSKLKAMYH